MDKQELFATDNIELAAYLLTRKLTLSGSGSDGRFITFFFPKHQVDPYISEFINNTPVPVRDYNSAMETLRDLIKEKHRERVG